jgi:hypothetical protein
MAEGPGEGAVLIRVLWSAVAIAAAFSAGAASMTEPTDPLNGRATLVERDFDGNLKRLAQPPEEAALALIAVAESERDAIRVVRDARFDTIDRVIAGNIPLLLKFQSLRDTGNRRDLSIALRELSDKLTELRARGRLRDEMAGALTEANASEYRRLTDEYWRVLLDDSTRQAQAIDKNAKPADVAARELLRALGDEVQRSFERRIDGADVPDLVRRTTLDSDRQAAAAEIFGEPASTAQEKRAAAMRVLALLTPEQREAIVGAMYGANIK